MKNPKFILAIVLIVSIVAVAVTGRADNSTNAPVKPYPLKTCLVCGMELGMMGKPYVFTNTDQEIKLCSKSEKADFDKDPDKYMKKLADAEAKLKK
jgi:nitrous oxide reductase accessory protein NosL